MAARVEDRRGDADRRLCARGCRREGPLDDPNAAIADHKETSCCRLEPYGCRGPPPKVKRSASRACRISRLPRPRFDKVGMPAGIAATTAASPPTPDRSPAPPWILPGAFCSESQRGCEDRLRARLGMGKLRQASATTTKARSVLAERFGGGYCACAAPRLYSSDCSYARSYRSAFMTFTQAATKSLVNFSCESAQA